MPEVLTQFTRPDSNQMLLQVAKDLRALESKVLRNEKGVQPTAYKLLSTGATDMLLSSYSTVKVTPNGNASYTTSVPPAGYRATILILTSGTSSYTITFGTGFKTTGTLATGVTSARLFAVNFVSDGTNLYEVSRTTAMVA